MGTAKLLIAAVLLTPGASVAQRVPCVAGLGAQVRAPDPSIQDQLGPAASVDAAALRLKGAEPDTSLTAPCGAVTRREDGRAGGLSGAGALIGAGSGLLIGGAVGAYLDGRHLSTHGPLLPLTATGGAIVGGLLGAGGTAALKGAGIGLLVGGGVGVVAGLAVGGGHDCDGGCGGLAALALGGLGAGAGVVIGAVVGMASRGDGAHDASPDRVHVSVAPSSSGVTMGASVPF